MNPAIVDLDSKLATANERIRELDKSHTEASDLFADCVAGQAALRRRLKVERKKLNAEREVSDKLVDELEDVLDWANVERAPLRAQEIASIRRVLAEVAAIRTTNTEGDQ